MKDSSKIRTIIFNILVVLTLLFIYMLFFPKKSYLNKRLNKELNSTVEKTFNQNVNAIKIAGEEHFKNSSNSKVTVEELINENLLAELKDSNGNTCNNASYIEKQEGKTIIYLECDDKKEKVTLKDESFNIDLNDNNECLYKYQKDSSEYSDWGEWSEWSKDPVESNNLVNVETKIEKEVSGTKEVSDTRTVKINANKNTNYTCPNGYTLDGTKCKKLVENNSISASVSYSCPNGYGRNGTECYKNGNKIAATKTYFCPTVSGNVVTKLEGSICRVYTVYDTKDATSNTYYTCNKGYTLKGNSCYKTEEYTKQIEDYIDVTYYRYQTRAITNEKFDIKWSEKDDQKLLEEGYTIVEEISC